MSGCIQKVDIPVSALFVPNTLIANPFSSHASIHLQRLNKIFKPSASEIDPGLFLGNSCSSHDIPTLHETQISATVSIGNGMIDQWTRQTSMKLVPPERRLLIPALDTSTQDLLQHMTIMCDFIDQMRLSAEQQPPQSISPEQVSTTDPTTNHFSNVVLVHCDKGVSRSVTVITVYLVRKYRMPFPEALALVKGKRRVNPNPSFREPLKAWEDTGYNVCEDVDAKIPNLRYQKYLKGELGG